jgi:tetratricopeptide (TPR) repeat protein
MSTTDATDLVSKGLEALQRDLVYLAQSCFEQAIEQDRSPAACSYLAFCLASTRKDYAKAIALAEEAIAREPANSVYYLNLERIYLMAGDKKHALQVLRKGIQQGDDPQILAELNLHGTRKPPLFPSLPRTHPLNKFLGLILCRLGLKQ